MDTKTKSLLLNIIESLIIILQTEYVYLQDNQRVSVNSFFIENNAYEKIIEI